MTPERTFLLQCDVPLAALRGLPCPKQPQSERESLLGGRLDVEQPDDAFGRSPRLRAEAPCPIRRDREVPAITPVTRESDSAVATRALAEPVRGRVIGHEVKLGRDGAPSPDRNGSVETLGPQRPAAFAPAQTI